MSKESCLTIFPEIEMVTRKLSDEQFGILIRAVIAYRFRGEFYSGEDAALDIAFQFLASQVDRSEAAKDRKSKAAKARWNAEPMQTDAEPMQKDAPIQSVPVQSVPFRSSPNQIYTTHALSANPAEKRSYGKFGWILLSDEEYAQLEKELGSEELNRCIAYVDESAQANGNRNGWQDFAVVLRKCSQQGWGRRRGKPKADIPKGASGELGSAELEAIQALLKRKEEKP